MPADLPAGPTTRRNIPPMSFGDYMAEVTPKIYDALKKSAD